MPAPFLAAGDLRHRVSLQSNTATTQADDGQPAETWETYATVWAAVEPLAGRELTEAQKLKAEVTHRVRLRWLPSATVSALHRVLLADGRRLEIEAVRDLGEEHVVLELLCRVIG